MGVNILGSEPFENWTNPASQNRKPKSQLGLWFPSYCRGGLCPPNMPNCEMGGGHRPPLQRGPVHLEIYVFGFEMQDSSNFKFFFSFEPQLSQVCCRPREYQPPPP